MSLILLAFQGCKPPATETDFTPLIAPPPAEKAIFTTDEEVPVEVYYTVETNENSVDVWLKLLEQPKNGSLSECQNLDKTLFKCIYTPKKDFYGEDKVYLTQGDGGLLSGGQAEIIVNVNPINDAPVAQDERFGFPSGDKVVYQFMAPPAIDSDTAAKDLTYEIISADGANLYNCFRSPGDRVCTIIVEDKTFEGSFEISYQVTDQEGLISNSATLKVDISQAVMNAEIDFMQEKEKKLSGVDIVWIVDNSGSMGNDQENLKQNFSSFIDNFLENGKAKFEFNMAVTATDVYKNLIGGVGPFRLDGNGNVYDLTSVKAEADFASFKADFEKAALVGTDGSGDERALESFEKSYELQPSWFGGNDRLLVGIILSDEREQSSKTIEQYATRFKALKDDPNKVKFYPIINLGEDRENRYANLAQQFGTQVEDIRMPFDGVLNSISTSVVNTLLSNFALEPTHNVLLDTLQVFVNGVLVTRGVDYNFTDQAVVFVNPPPANAVIKVRYSYKWK